MIIRNEKGEIIFSGEDLQGANLLCADLRDANLRDANLHDANLRGANLRDADLQGANLQGANLQDANLQGANLQDADLHGADLHGANLQDANLLGANLQGANFSKNDIKTIAAERKIIPDGDVVGYKKLRNGTVCVLRIPADAKRVGGVVGRKCRAEYAVVVEGKGVSAYDSTFRYVAGATVRPSAFCDNPSIECAEGIHFFLTRKEAENYNI